MIQSKTSDFYEIGIRFDKTQEDGNSKKVTEKYAFDALSFSEAEERAIKNLESYISGDYKIISNALANYHEVIIADNDKADRWYKLKAAYITYDEKTEKEKRLLINFLVQGANLKNALDNFDTFMERTMVDYNIVSVAETKLMDVYFYKKESKKNEIE